MSDGSILQTVGVSFEALAATNGAGGIEVKTSSRAAFYEAAFVNNVAFTAVDFGVKPQGAALYASSFSEVYFGR